MPCAQRIGMVAKMPESVDSNDAKHIEVAANEHVLRICKRFEVNRNIATPRGRAAGNHHHHHKGNMKGAVHGRVLGDVVVAQGVSVQDAGTVQRLNLKDLVDWVVSGTLI